MSDVSTRVRPGQTMVAPRVIRDRSISRGGLLLGLMLVALWVTSALGSGEVNTGTFETLFGAVADNALLALALGLGIIVGQFDLSVVATYGLGATLAISVGLGPVESAMVAVAAGAVVGAVQGLIVTRFGISAVTVTLGGFLTIAGVVTAISDGETVNYDNLNVTLWLTTAKVWALAPGMIITGFVFLLIGAMLRMTRIGRSMRAVGGDPTAARISGVRNNLVVTGALTLGGAVAALGGALHGFSASAANATVTFTPIIAAITAIVAGGMSLNGGYGKAGQILTGVFTMALFTQCLAIGAVDPTLAGLVTGLFLLVVASATPELRDWVAARRPRARS